MTSNVNLNTQGTSSTQFQKDLALYNATMENLEQNYFSGQGNDPLSYWPSSPLTQGMFNNPFDFTMHPDNNSFGDKLMKFIGDVCAMPLELSSAIFKGIGKLVDAPFELVGNIVKGLGEFVNKIGDGYKKFYGKIGEIMGKIPLVGSILNGLCKAAGWVTALPFKIAGGIVEFAGKLVKGVGDILKSPFEAIGEGLKKVGKGIKKFFKKL